MRTGIRSLVKKLDEAWSNLSSKELNRRHIARLIIDVESTIGLLEDIDVPGAEQDGGQMQSVIERVKSHLVGAKAALGDLAKVNEAVRK